MVAEGGRSGIGIAAAIAENPGRFPPCIDPICDWEYEYECERDKDEVARVSGVGGLMPICTDVGDAGSTSVPPPPPSRRSRSETTR